MKPKVLHRILLVLVMLVLFALALLELNQVKSAVRKRKAVLQNAVKQQLRTRRNVVLFDDA
mgnify:CR=1 FL=1